MQGEDDEETETYCDDDDDDDDDGDLLLSSSTIALCLFGLFNRMLSITSLRRPSSRDVQQQISESRYGRMCRQRR